MLKIHRYVLDKFRTTNICVSKLFLLKSKRFYEIFNLKKPNAC